MNAYICRSSGACDVWMIECYKYSAPLAPGPKTLTPVTY
jgi:hypothetical protein